MTNENDEIELKPIAVADGDSFFDVGEPETPQAAAVVTQEQQPPAPTESPSSSPETPPAAPEVPAYWKDIAPEDRATVAAAILSDLSPEERAKVAPLNEAVSQATQQAAARTQQNAQQQQEEARVRNEGLQTLNALRSSLQKAEIPDVDGSLRVIEDLSDAVQRDRAEAGRAIQSQLNAMKVTDIPAPVLAAVNQASTFGQVVSVYTQFIANKAYHDGRASLEKEYQTKTKADEAASAARIKNEHLAELAATGRLKDSVPPAISGNTPSAVSDMDDAEFTRIMGDPDEYDKAMANPLLKSQIEKLMTAAFA